MKLSRRDFLKLSGAGAGSLLLDWTLSPTTLAASEGAKFPLHKKVSEAATICPYCSCGCGLLIATDETGHIVNSEGDPENINNRGALDPKSISVRQLSQSPLRLRRPLYRAPGSAEFVEMEWDEAIAKVAEKIKATRDSTLKPKNDAGVTVNRTEGIAFIGGAANNDEECYLFVKMARALGGVYIEHQARI